MAATLVLVACTGTVDTDGDDSLVPRVEAAVEELTRAWSGLDPDAFGAATDEPQLASTTLRAMLDELAVATAAVQPAGAPDCSGADSCTQPLQVTLMLVGIGTWEYGTAVSVAQSDDPVVTWDASVLHPAMTAGTGFDRIRTVPRRAPILDRSGDLLTSLQPAFRIGVEPGKAGGSTYPRLAELLGIDGDALRQRAKASEPQWFVDVITLRIDDWRPVRDQVLDVPGVVIDFVKLPLTPTSTWGRAVLGSVSPATAETLEAAGDLALGTDLVGSSGLQAAYEEQLAGTPGGVIRLVGPTSRSRPQLVWRRAPERGEPLATTLAYGIQQAGEEAVAGQDKTTVLVAVDARTGEILADVNGPEITSYDTGLVGEYPPGSTFKVVSSAALLQAGQRVGDPAACPSTTVVDGKRFRNYEFTSLPAGATFADTIAASCNTTVVDRADELDDRSVAAAAEQFGVGAEWGLPLPAFTGSVPVSTSLVDRAASMIGQGRVLMSPLGMAMVAATVSSGQARTPSLLPDQVGDEVGSLPAAVIADLRRIMRLVVTEGTATTLRGLPGEVAAKTGTAEYGSRLPLRTHGWMIGYRGDLAFACLVVDGAGGNSAAGPVVRAFLQRAPRRW